jgi:hypothetical protein
MFDTATLNITTYIFAANANNYADWIIIIVQDCTHCRSIRKNSAKSILKIGPIIVQGQGKVVYAGRNK